MGPAGTAHQVQERTRAGEPARCGPDLPVRRVVLYVVAGQRYALPLDAVDRVVPVVAITVVPQAPKWLAGVINVAGRMVPVVNCRLRYGLPEREVELSDQLILARIGSSEVALWVDAVEGVIERDENEWVSPGEVLPGGSVTAALKLEDGSFALIQDVRTPLAFDDSAKPEYPALEAS